jgi:hypothetical protein
LADDLINDNYFMALDAKAEIAASRYAIHTNSYAYLEKRRSASLNASSVIADLTYTTAKQNKARTDFHNRPGPGIDLTTGTTGTSGGSSSSSSSSGYGQSFFGSGSHTPTTRPTSQSSREREEGRARFSRLLESFRSTRSPSDPRSPRTPTSPPLYQSKTLSSPIPRTQPQSQPGEGGEGAGSRARDPTGWALAGEREGWSRRPLRPPLPAVFKGNREGGEERGEEGGGE